MIEGLYDVFSDKMVMDYATVYLRSVTPPFNVVESNGGSLDSAGKGRYFFFDAVNNAQYFIMVQHRNSIETWSKNPVFFIQNQLSYNFTNAATKAYGNNLVLKENKWCNYSGDADQDGAVDLNDIVIVHNDASGFITGYVDSDMNGDKLVDLIDLLITFNNANKFVETVHP